MVPVLMLLTLCEIRRDERTHNVAERDAQNKPTTKVQDRSRRNQSVEVHVHLTDGGFKSSRTRMSFVLIFHVLATAAGEYTVNSEVCCLNLEYLYCRFYRSDL